MNRLLFFWILLWIASTTWGDSFVLNNQALHAIHSKKSSFLIQWATSSKEVEENNMRLKQGKKLNPDSLQIMTQIRKISVEIPTTAKYFRILVWSKGVEEPDFLTNWVDIVPRKNYTLNKEHLIPFVLLSGMGC